MKLNLGLTFVASLLLLTGCKEVKIENGRIPDQYLKQAAEYAGTYAGTFQGVKSVLTLSLEGNLAKVSYQDARGNDIIDPTCESKFGLLQTITVSGSEEKPNLDAAAFAFDANKCTAMVVGRTLYLEFKKKQGAVKMSAGIVQRRDWEHTCTGGSPFPTNCTTRQVPVFIRGSFVKQN